MFSDQTVNSNRILYTPSVFAKSSLCYLQEIGTLTAIKPHTSKRKDLKSYLFFVVLSGRGVLDYRNKTYVLQTGDCVFINCEESYAHTTSKESLWSIKWAHFYGENVPGIYGKYLERGGAPVFHPSNSERYTDLLEQLFITASSEDYLRDMKINEALASLLTLIMEMSWQPENQASMRRGSGREYTLQDIKDYLDENWKEKIALDKLADMFYINKYYLTRLFKNQYGISILNYVLNKRITHAKHQLRFTDKTIEAIGIECGFEDSNYFSRTFKRVEGAPPNEYRKLWKR